MKAVSEGWLTSAEHLSARKKNNKHQAKVLDIVVLPTHRCLSIPPRLKQICVSQKAISQGNGLLLTNSVPAANSSKHNGVSW